MLALIGFLRRLKVDSHDAKTPAIPQKKEREESVVEYAAHKRFCEQYSVTLTREHIKFEEYDRPTKTGVPFQRWSSSVLRCKSLNQWVAKVTTVHDDDAAKNINTLVDVIEAILAQEPDVLNP